MSGAAHDPARCAAIADDLPLLALGTLSGRGRSEVLDHIESCPHCRTELEQLSLVAETVQQLAPDVQPPLGFELRLAERLQGAATARRRPRRLAMMSAAAALMIVAFGVGILVASGAGTGSGRSAASAPVTANLTSGGEVVGAVMVSPGTPAWMLVTIRGGRWQGRVTCEVTLSGGQVATIGAFTLSGEYPAWAAPLPVTGGAVRSARLIDSSGTILASAEVGV